MPTYQYECEACGHHFEILQSMRDAKLRKCPECKKLKLQRLLGFGGGIIFKGTGFYETDYKKKDSSPKKDSPKAASPGCGVGPGGCACAKTH
ncbi:MAG: zinc ribbon domain-containing protein [Candidatus Omnitrophica bacterium]|nr:zinc ribbon domain-containing protein [Candidatus Omnitrophota bacterium]